MAQVRRAEARWIEARQRWQLNAQRDGKRRTFTSSTPGRRGKHEAEAKADEWLEAGQPDDIRFDVAWSIYLDCIKKTTGTANYYDNESIGRIWLLPALGKKRLSKLRMADIQAIVDDAVEKGKAARTCKNIKSKYFGFALFAKDRKWEIENIKPEKVKISKKAPKAERTIVQPDQLKALFSVDTETYRGTIRPCFYIHAFRFFVLTGLRRGELCGLSAKDHTNNAIIIRKAINRHNEITGGKNENAHRRVPLTSRAEKVLQDQEKMLQQLGIKSKYLFPDDEGKAIDPPNLYKRWVYYAKQNGITSSLHELRHTFVSIAENDIPEPLLKRIVGHSESMDTHGVYGHELDTDLKRALTMMEEVFDRILD